MPVRKRLSSKDILSFYTYRIIQTPFLSISVMRTSIVSCHQSVPELFDFNAMSVLFSPNARPELYGGGPKLPLTPSVNDDERGSEQDTYMNSPIIEECPCHHNLFGIQLEADRRVCAKYVTTVIAFAIAVNHGTRTGGLHF